MGQRGTPSKWPFTPWQKQMGVIQTTDPKWGPILQVPVANGQKYMGNWGEITPISGVRGLYL